MWPCRYKSERLGAVQGAVDELLTMNADLSVRAISHAEGFWFVHAEHMDRDVEGRELVTFKSYNAFVEGLNGRLREQRSLKCLHFAEDMVRGVCGAEGGGCPHHPSPVAGVL